MSAATDPIDGDATGSWHGDAERNTPKLSLNPDGRLDGTDGCNRLFGSWEAHEATVVFLEVASTRMLCRNVDDWLSKLATASVDGDLMTVFNAEGRTIGTLRRVDEMAKLAAFRETL